MFTDKISRRDLIKVAGRYGLSSTLLGAAAMGGALTLPELAAAAECVTLQAAAGFNVHLFPTGQGNVIGNPIEPVIKLTANPSTAETMKEHIDLDVSGILKREMNLDQAGDELINITVRTANGRSTCAESLGHREFVLTKLFRSA